MSKLFNQTEERVADAAWPMLELLERLTAIPDATLAACPELQELHDEACQLIAFVRGNKKEVAP